MELTDAERGRALVERWCVLAEQRLDYLTELFETGRWRRLFGEVAFLENIQGAKAAVESWRSLLNREASLDNRPVDLSWLGHNKQLAQRPSFAVGADRIAEQAPMRFAAKLPPAPPREPAPAPVADPSPQLTIIAEAPQTVPAFVTDELPAWHHALEPARLEQRYPLLRKVG
jgi:uncharacterized repeat protein (TIGR03809 family)